MDDLDLVPFRIAQVGRPRPRPSVRAVWRLRQDHYREHGDTHLPRKAVSGKKLMPTDPVEEARGPMPGSRPSILNFYRSDESDFRGHNTDFVLTPGVA